MSDHLPAKSLSTYLRLVTISGCLAMVYVACVTSPTATKYLQSLNANDLHFGLMMGVPMCMLLMQFVGAWLTNRVRHRKPAFMAMAICARLMDLCVAFLPLLFPAFLPPERWLPIFICIVAFNSCLANLTVPLWFSWMGDMVPRRIFNRYWGGRQRYMTFVWTLTYLGIAGITYKFHDLSPRILYPGLAAVGVAAGIIDILLFLRIREPENVTLPGRGLVETMIEPLRDPQYRTVVTYGCWFTASAMLGAAFMQVYVVKVLAMPMWQINVAWCTVGLGSALVSRMWGRIADKYGHRPVLIICTALKPFITIVFLLVTKENAFWVFCIAFTFDGMVNAGYAIALNGFMLKTAPRENRSMFIAAVSSLTGIAGGLGCILGGWLLKQMGSWEWYWLGRIWNNYHVIFLISTILRIFCIFIAYRIREPASASPITVVTYIRDLWPIRMVMYPVGLYRRHSPHDEEGEEPSLPPLPAHPEDDKPPTKPPPKAEA